MLLQLMLMLGLGTTLAAIIPFVPDVKFLVDNGMTLLFFLSGVFFRFDAIPESVRALFDYNPVAALIFAYRRVLVEGGSLEWSTLLPVSVFALFFCLLGGYLLKTWDRTYAKRAFV
jgi:lipopolysaccharide transport system permease protein